VPADIQVKTSRRGRSITTAGQGFDGGHPAIERVLAGIRRR
jgi:hypothetical protein